MEVGLTIIEFIKIFGKKHAPIKIPVAEILKSMGDILTIEGEQSGLPTKVFYQTN